jgi:hypothetical protein
MAEGLFSYYLVEGIFFDQSLLMDNKLEDLDNEDGEHIYDQVFHNDHLHLYMNQGANKSAKENHRYHYHQRLS